MANVNDTLKIFMDLVDDKRSAGQDITPDDEPGIILIIFAKFAAKHRELENSPFYKRLHIQLLNENPRAIRLARLWRCGGISFDDLLYQANNRIK